MGMVGSEIEALIREAFPDADVIVTELGGTGRYCRARIVSQTFAGKSRIQQHQMIYEALKGKIAGTFQTLVLKITVPK